MKSTTFFLLEATVKTLESGGANLVEFPGHRTCFQDQRCLIAACAAARIAVGTLKGEQLT
jgi:hypothetical protein